MDDEDFIDLRLEIQEKFKFLVSKDYFYDAVQRLARRNSFHPVRDYLNALKWDGVSRIEAFFINGAGADDTPYTRAVTRIFFIAAVRRIREPGCKYDEVIVLEGVEGTGRSTLVKNLAVNAEWFSDDFPLGSDAKTTIEKTDGKWIIECAELKDIKKKDVESVKAQLSRQVDISRLSYGRMSKDVSRQFVVIGTTNDSQYLNSTTGNRRFWPIRIKRVTLPEKLPKEFLDQVWAEAAHYEAAGESIRLPKKLWQAAREEQASRELDNIYLEHLEAAVGDQKGYVRVVDVYAFLGISPSRKYGEVAKAITEAMAMLGFEKKLWAMKKEGQATERAKCFVKIRDNTEGHLEQWRFRPEVGRLTG